MSHIALGYEYIQDLSLPIAVMLTYAKNHRIEAVQAAFFFFLLLPPLCQVVTVTFHFVIFGVDLQMLTSLCNLPFVS